jgi:hypothetical protein
MPSADLLAPGRCDRPRSTLAPSNLERLKLPVALQVRRGPAVQHHGAGGMTISFVHAYTLPGTDPATDSRRDAYRAGGRCGVVQVIWISRARRHAPGRQTTILGASPDAEQLASGLLVRHVDTPSPVAYVGCRSASQQSSTICCRSRRLLGQGVAGKAHYPERAGGLCTNRRLHTEEVGGGTRGVRYAGVPVASAARSHDLSRRSGGAAGRDWTCSLTPRLAMRLRALGQARETATNVGI